MAGQSSADADQAEPDRGQSSQRAAKLATAMMKQLRSQAEGEKLLDRFQLEGSQVLAEVEIPDCEYAELERAFKSCVPLWDRNQEKDVDELVQKIQDKSSSTMEADDRFRHLQKKIGCKLRRGLLTPEVLAKAQARCHAYWSRVTPGNVALIVDKITGKCEDWPSACKKFDWIWSKGEWRSGNREVNLNGRVYTAEDLEQAERRCREKYGLPASGGERRVGGGDRRPRLILSDTRKAAQTEPSKAPAEKATPNPAPAACAAPPATDAAPVDEPAANQEAVERDATPADNTAPEETAAADTAVAAGAPDTARDAAPGDPARGDEAADPTAPAPEADQPEPENQEPKEPKDHQRASNGEFLAECIQRKCSSMATAKKFFDWLRARVQTGDPKFRGRTCVIEDVEEAERRCKEVWAGIDDKKDKSGNQTQRDGDSSSSSSSSSGSGRGKAKEKKAAGGVDELVAYVMGKTSNPTKIESYFSNLFGKVGKVISVIGRALSQEETTEAWLRCTRAAEQAMAAKKKTRPEKPSRRQSSKKLQSPADSLVRDVLRKCSDMTKAQHYLNWFHKNVGKPGPDGRILSLQEVTEAELRVMQFFEEGGGRKDSSSSEGSSSSSYKPRRGRPRKSKEELKKSKSKKDLKRKRTGGEELEGALFGSDSEELSGEESVDAEEEASFSAAVLADLGEVNDEPQAVEDGYPSQHWEECAREVLPGFEGFNRRATAVMIKAEVGQGSLQVTFDEQAACPPLQPHQEAVGFLMHPKSPVRRLLVDHPTGSGKTREMIRVLDNYFFDGRPKIPIFPKDPVCRNFYAELLRWPSRYRDYFCCERPADAAIASGRPSWKEYRNHLWDLSSFSEEEVRRLGYSIREVLEMKGMFYMGRVRKSLRAAFHRKHPGECMPAAPLRALGYTSAGGSFANIGGDNKPMSSLMKIAYATGTGNVYCNKIVLMDEAHNLVRSQTQYAEQLQRLRRLLFEARNLVLAGFTGTPILSEPSEGRQLLDIIKGVLAPDGDEGYLSSFPMRPQPLFPVSLPRGLPDGVLTLARKRQLIRKVEMRGEALKVYDIKRRLGLPGRRLRAYCNVSIFHAAFHDGRAGSKKRILANPDDCCPKLLAIAEAVVASSLKAVIMIARTSGYTVMLELMKYFAAKAEPPFSVATINELSEFNHCSNLRGEVFRVLVADSMQCSEGVSFLSVRRTFLADVPVSPSGFIQQCGRAIRMYGHRGLPTEEQTVTTQLFVTMLPKWMRSSSLACWALRAQKKHTSGKEVEKRARVLTARMNRAGIASLEELKTKLDAHGLEKQKSLGRTGREGLTADDVMTFLEQNGLWEEARLLRADNKKERELKEKAGEQLQRQGTESQLLRGATLESVPENEPELEDFANALESMIDEELGAKIREGAEDDEEDRKREMEAFKEEQDVQDEELDGDESQRKAATKAPAPQTRSIAAAMTPAEVASCLTEALGVLRGACRDADRKPLANDAKVVRRNSSKVFGQTAEEPTTMEVESAAPANASAAAVAATDANSAADAADAPSTSADADAADTSNAEVPQAQAAPDGGQGQPPAKTAEVTPAFGEEPWRQPLVAGLEKARRCEAFVTAFRSALPSLDPLVCDLKMLTVHQVRTLRDEIAKVEKVETLRMAVALIKEVKTAVAEAEALAPVAPAATSNPEPLQVETAPAPPDELMPAAAEASVESAPADALAEAPAEAEATREAPARQLPSETPAVAAPAPAELAKAEETRKAAELAWHRKLAAAFRELRRSDHVKAAFEVACPGLVEKAVAADAKAEKEEVHDNDEQEQDADLLSLGIGPEHVKRLYDELHRLLEQAEKGVAKPRALVRAMQMLYLAETTADAAASLKPETADEEALSQLTERTEEFAPALEAMRSLAVDRDVFAHLADELVEEHAEAQESESEASDLNKELVGKKNEPAPVVLPAGWRMEWVKRKKKEMREFVDPDGNRYRNVKEVRAALLEVEAQEAAQKAAEKAAAFMASKRRRLRGKCASAAFDNPGPLAVASTQQTMEEAAFEKDLLQALGVDDTTDPKAAEPASKKDAEGKVANGRVQNEPASKVAPQPPAEAGPKPSTGAKVRIKGLVADSDLNGKLGRLGDLNSNERWECFLENGLKVNIKECNFDVISAPSVAKRPAPSPPEGRRVQARGRGRGRGRGKQAANAAALDEESD